MQAEGDARNYQTVISDVFFRIGTRYHDLMQYRGFGHENVLVGSVDRGGAPVIFRLSDNVRLQSVDFLPYSLQEVTRALIHRGNLI